MNNRGDTKSPLQHVQHSQVAQLDNANRCALDGKGKLTSVVIILDPHTSSPTFDRVKSHPLPSVSPPSSTSGHVHNGGHCANQGSEIGIQAKPKHSKLRLKLWNVFCRLLDHLFGWTEQKPRLTLLTIDDRQDALPHCTVLLDSTLCFDTQALDLACKRLCESLTRLPILLYNDLETYANGLLSIISNKHKLGNVTVHLLTAPVVANVLNKLNAPANDNYVIWIPSSMNVDKLFFALKQIITPAFVVPIILTFRNSDKTHSFSAYPRFILPQMHRCSRPPLLSTLSLTCTHIVSLDSIVDDYLYGIPYVVRCTSDLKSEQRAFTLLLTLLKRRHCALLCCQKLGESQLSMDGTVKQWHLIIPASSLDAEYKIDGHQDFAILRRLAVEGCHFSTSLAPEQTFCDTPRSLLSVPDEQSGYHESFATSWDEFSDSSTFPNISIADMLKQHERFKSSERPGERAALSLDRYVRLVN